MRRRVALAVSFVLAAALLTTAAPAEALPSGFRYVTRTKTVKPISRGALKAPCPRGTKVLSGGTTISGGNSFNRMGGSSPYDSKDKGRAPDDGWLGVMLNPTPNERVMTTYAVCARAKPVYVKAAPFVLQAGDNEFNTVDCPAGKVPVGGGGTLSTTSMDIWLRLTTPSSNSMDPTLDDGWATGAYNDTGVVQRLTVHVVCETADPSIHHIDTSLPLPMSPASQAVTMECAEGQRVVGGGGSLTPVTNTEINSTGFSDTTGDGIPDAWTTRFSNAAGPAESAPVRAICMDT